MGIGWSGAGKYTGHAYRQIKTQVNVIARRIKTEYKMSVMLSKTKQEIMNYVRLTHGYVDFQPPP